jgi:hypothetical protein
VNWQSGIGRLRLAGTVVPVALVGPGNWVADIADFFDDNVTADRAVGLANSFLQSNLQKFSGISADLGRCQSLGVMVDQPSGSGDAFVWDIPCANCAPHPSQPMD